MTWIPPYDMPMRLQHNPHLNVTSHALWEKQTQHIDGNINHVWPCAAISQRTHIFTRTLMNIEWNKMNEPRSVTTSLLPNLHRRPLACCYQVIPSAPIFSAYGSNGSYAMCFFCTQMRQAPLPSMLLPPQHRLQLLARPCTTVQGNLAATRTAATAQTAPYMAAAGVRLFPSATAVDILIKT